MDSISNINNLKFKILPTIKIYNLLFCINFIFIVNSKRHSALQYFNTIRKQDNIEYEYKIKKIN